MSITARELRWLAILLQICLVGSKHVLMDSGIYYFYRQQEQVIIVSVPFAPSTPDNSEEAG